MLTKLIIKNFQSHRSTEIDFSSGVNVILGQSDSGKSAIFRALNWVISNRPTGDAFRSLWGGETSVTLVLDNHTVTRFKSDTKNLYILDSQEFTAFGTSVPDEIIKALNIGSINTQFQGDRSYLISETPGAVATHFNSIANFEQIDKSMSFVDTNLRTFNAKVKETTDTIKKKKEELIQYSNLDRASDLYIRVKTTEETLINSKNKITQIEKILYDLETVNTRLEKLSKFQSLNEPVTEALTLNKELKNNSGQQLKLRKLINNLNVIASKLGKAEEIAAHQPKVLEILSQYQYVNEIKTKIKDIKNFTGIYDQLSADIEKLKISQKKLELLFYTNFPKTCPLCGK